ncbi:MetQ/NlpA family ABC transporter substrate-binding protein [Ornithinimicrobium sufpigmenti]|uniref:MetQ/NlpA family ABC transporter substrate-binding protein n=1 Tax=Ornithinimicrobium sufpigmenti TaxID=2508882 RepID=UPI001035E069|nr:MULTISPECIES: MetQ/NlpA family ABC transporter substrate-binding protein [unclassified Ornithinimicrobium]
MKKIHTVTLAGALPLALILGACAAPGTLDSGDDDASGEKTTITYSKSQGPYTELFEDAVAPILEEEGYTLQSQDVSDLLTADIALNDGDVDFNVEQHTAYLEAFNAENDGDLVPITPIPTVPAGIYSDRHDSLDDVPQGATVAVPNDASNMARAYLLLEKIGWIELDESADPTAVTGNDIVANPHDLDITEMRSLTIPPASVDFDYIVITGSIVYNAGIDPATALATEDILDHLVLQVVVKEENAEEPWAQAIVNAYHSEEFATYMEENNDGLWWIPEELQ